ncbi:hypothetical protein KEM54_000273, partial [Ascosphaera aggregata]
KIPTFNLSADAEPDDAGAALFFRTVLVKPPTQSHSETVIASAPSPSRAQGAGIASEKKTLVRAELPGSACIVGVETVADPSSSSLSSSKSSSSSAEVVSACLATLKPRRIEVRRVDHEIGSVEHDLDLAWRTRIESDDWVLLTYHALACDFQFAPRFESVKGDAHDGDAAVTAAPGQSDGGVKLLDPEGDVTAWRTSRDESWKSVKARACRLALNVWKRKVGWWWPVPETPTTTTTKLMTPSSGVSMRFAELLTEYVKRFLIGSGTLCKLVKHGDDFQCEIEIQGYLRYGSGRTYSSPDEAIENEAYDLFFALSTSNSDGVTPDDQDSVYEEDDSDYLEIICERPPQEINQWDSRVRTSRNWSRRFDNGRSETLKRKRDSDQENNVSKRIRTNDGKKLVKNDHHDAGGGSGLPIPAVYHDRLRRAEVRSRQRQRYRGRQQSTRKHLAVEIDKPGDSQKPIAKANRPIPAKAEDQHGPNPIPGPELLSSDRQATIDSDRVMNADTEPGQVGKDGNEMESHFKNPQPSKTSDIPKHSQQMTPFEGFQASRRSFDSAIPILGTTQDRSITDCPGINQLSVRGSQGSYRRNAWNDPTSHWTTVGHGQRRMPNNADIALANLLLITLYTGLCRLLYLPTPLYQYYRVHGRHDQVVSTSEYNYFKSDEVAIPSFRAGVFFLGVPALMARNPWGLANTWPSSTLEEAKEACAAAVVWELMRMMESGSTI